MDFSERHAEFVGLHFGDGSLTERKGTDSLRFQLRGDAVSDREHYENFIIPLCNELIGFPLLGRRVSTIFDRKLNSFGISLESTKISQFFRELGVPVGVKEELPIPKWVLENLEFSKAFVRGLFDTDGTISFKKNNTAKSKLKKVCVIKIVSVSEELILGVSKILSNLKIKHYLIVEKKTNGERNAFKTEVYKPHTSEFMRIIGSHNPKHLTKFKIYERFGFCPTKTSLEQRQLILKGLLDPYSLTTAGVP